MISLFQMRYIQKLKNVDSGELDDQEIGLPLPIHFRSTHNSNNLNNARERYSRRILSFVSGRSVTRHY